MLLCNLSLNEWKLHLFLLETAFVRLTFFDASLSQDRGGILRIRKTPTSSVQFKTLFSKSWLLASKSIAIHQTENYA